MSNPCKWGMLVIQIYSMFALSSLCKARVEKNDLILYADRLELFWTQPVNPRKDASVRERRRSNSEILPGGLDNKQTLELEYLQHAVNIDLDGMLLGILGRLVKVSLICSTLSLDQICQEYAAGQVIDFGQDETICRAQLSNPSLTEAAMHRVSAIGGQDLAERLFAGRADQLSKNVLQGTTLDPVQSSAQTQNIGLVGARKLQRQSLVFQELLVSSTLLDAAASCYQKYRILAWIMLTALGGALVIIVLLVEVIRRRLQAEKALHENERRYKDLAEAGANIFWELDCDLNLSYVSDLQNETSSILSARAMGQPLSQVFAEEKFEFNANRLDALLKWRRSIQDFILFVKEKDQEIRIFKLNGKPIFDECQRYKGYRGILRDITDEYFLTKKIAYQAAYDSLTNLLNRNEFDARLQAAVSQAKEDNSKFVLCYLDLDQFKLVNDTAGHLVGDQLLTELAQLLKHNIRPKDILGRLGGDEFGLLMSDCTLLQAQLRCDQLVMLIQDFRFQWHDSQFRVGVSIGIVAFANASYTAEKLLSRADLACYKAKDAGRGRVYVANQNDHEIDRSQLQMSYIADIPQAIEEDRLFLFKQPIQAIDSAQDRCRHYEILLRMRDGEHNIIGPGLFIPAAERYGVIGRIDKWVLESTLNQYFRCGLNDDDAIVSINLSGASINDERSTALFSELIIQSNVPPGNICIEITETATISQLDQALRLINSLKKIGVKFALDDFGSGVSSLSYLKSLPVDYLKIDGGLIKNIATDVSDREIVLLINELAHKRGMKTVAEFVEDHEILEQLRIIGVDYAQGYAIGKPKPLGIPVSMA